jgi:predicted permease
MGLMIERGLFDLRYTLRSLGRHPGFTLVIVATLALGIGANTAIFSLLDQLLLRRLPVERPEELVILDGPGPFAGRTNNDQTFSYPMYRDFRDSNQVFTGVIARFPTAISAGIDGVVERVQSELVSGNYFDVLGVRPLIGRAFHQDDDLRPGGHPVVMLSHGYWVRRFGRDPFVLNKTIDLNGRPMTVVGIAPPGFRSVDATATPDVFVPLMMKASMTPSWDDLENRRTRWVNVIARLRPGVSSEQAATAMNVLYRQLNEQEVKALTTASAAFRQRFVNKPLVIAPGGGGFSNLRSEVSMPLFLMMGMVGLVLMIACANIASLLMARSASQEREVAICLALGAARRRVVSQRILESVSFACLGGAAGLLVAAWTGDLLIAALMPRGLGASLTTTFDARLVLFTVVVSLVTALLFGLGPAIQSSRPSLTNALKEGGTVLGGRRHVRLRKGLVVAQVALAVLLLSGAGLFARSLYNLRHLDPGFRPDGLLTFSVDPSLGGYAQTRLIGFVQALTERLAAMPGVRSVSCALIPAMASDEGHITVKVEGYESKDGEDMSPGFNYVGPAYFSTMGIPVLSGREFSDRDGASSPRVAVVNEAFARYFFGEDDPIGRRISFRRDNLSMEIVGVVENSKFTSLRETQQRYVYTPYMQQTSLDAITFYVRTASGLPASLGPMVLERANQLDRNLPLFDLRTVVAQIDDSLIVERMVAALSAAFGLLATMLAAIGLYGVMAYTVARRTREIGVRMALGAGRSDVVGLILHEAGMLAAAGVLVGLPAAYALTRLAQSQLFGVSSSDPLVMSGAVLFLVGVTLTAGFIPAHRASRVDAMTALRHE